MAVLKVKKATVYAHQTVTEDIVTELQRLSNCEVLSLEQQGSDPRKEQIARKTKEIEDRSADARFLLRFFEPYYEDSRGVLERLLSDKPPVTLKELEDLLKKTDINEIAEQARKIERRLVELRATLSYLDAKQSILETLEGFPYDLSLISQGTKNITSIFGNVPTEQTEKLKSAFEDASGDRGELFFGFTGEKAVQVPVVMIFDKSVSSDVVEAASSVTLSRVDFPKDLEGTVEDAKKLLAEERKKLLEEETNLKELAKGLSAQWVPTIQRLFDYHEILRKRYEALLQGQTTRKVSIIKLWVPENALEIFKNTLKRYEDLIEVALEDPDPAAGDDPPTMLENPKWALPFEPLTRLYGLPSYGGMDPTVPMAPFMFVFLGMCLGDGGYGLVLSMLILWLFSRYKITGDKRNFFNLLFLGSVSTIFFGAITGSWLGNMIDAFGSLAFLRSLKNSVVLLQPMENPLNFLGISLALGVIQVIFGLFLAMWENLRKGNYIAAFGDQGGWIALITGLLIFGGFSAGFLGQVAGFAGKVLSLLGVVLLVTTQGREKSGIVSKVLSGILSLYNITSYLGDILSYSRLLALGLATSAVAMIINTLTGLVIGIPFIGVVLAVLVFLGGHVFSIAVNTLGAFIHSLRLQYVEFFSKFYSGGGRAFEPLAYDTKYVQVQTAEAENTR